MLVINQMIRKSMESEETKASFKDMMDSIFKEQIDSRFLILEVRVAALEKRLSDQQAKVESHHETISSQQTQLTTQQASISAQQTQLTTHSVTTKQQFNMNQSGKLNNLMVAGIPEKENEEPANLIKQMAEATATTLGDFTAVRIGKPKSDKSRLILVSCTSHWDKHPYTWLELHSRPTATRIPISTKTYHRNRVNSSSM